jgi:hypothetical protein
MMKKIAESNNTYLNRLIIEAKDSYKLVKFLKVASWPAKYFFWGGGKKYSR